MATLINGGGALPQDLDTSAHPQFAALGVGTDPDPADGIALDVAGGAIRVANPETDGAIKTWQLLSRCFDTDQKDWAVFQAHSTSTQNSLQFGRGSSTVASPLTEVKIYTAPLGTIGAFPRRFYISGQGDVYVGDAPRPTTATVGFLHIPGGDGPPTGVPSAIVTGVTPTYYDYSSGRLYAYNSGWSPVGRGVDVPPSTCDARLTLTQGVPVTTSDVIGASTIYLTRYRGAHVALYDGSAWILHEVPSGDVSLALSGLTDGNLYDVFLHDSTGTLTLSLSAAWAGNVTRTDALAYQDGVRVLASDHTKRLVGTICATGATTTSSAVNFRYVRNEAHPVPQVVRVLGLAENWSYSTNEFRALNNDATCCIRYLSDGKSPLDVTAKMNYSNTTTTTVRQLALALDVIDKDYPYIAPGTNFWDTRALGAAVSYLSTRVPIMAAEGRHTVWPVERNNGATTAQWPGCNGVVLA